MKTHFLLASAGAALLGAAILAQAPPYDVLIRNGRVLDGSGNPWLAADIGIRGGRVIDVGRLHAASATRVIDAKGLTVTPGFVDVHSHSSTGLEGGLKEARQLIAQGIIDEGMIPKVEACLDSLRAGVRKTHMIDGRLSHALLLEIFTHRGVGTEIVIGA